MSKERRARWGLAGHLAEGTATSVFMVGNSGVNVREGGAA